MEKILSVVIPSYNMEKYLNQCVGSLVCSKYISDIEILIVNDGSKDGTRDIALKLERGNPESVKLIDKENGGHGSTINVGSANCKGKYFKVIDADDWVNTDELDKLVQALFNTDADCVICNYTSVYEEEGKEILNNVTAQFKPGQVISYNDYIKKYRLAMHSVVYKTELYRKSNIKLTEKCFYVDTEFIYFPLLTFETVVCFPFNVYQYRLQREGQSVSREGFLKHIEDHRKVMQELCSFYDGIPSQNGTVKEFLSKEIASHLCYQLSFVVNKRLTKAEWRNYKRFIKGIKTLGKEIYRKMPFKHRFINSCPVWTVRFVAKFL